MKPNLSMLYDRFAKFNHDIFDGVLPTPNITITHSIRKLGELIIEKKIKKGEWNYNLKYLGISDKFDRSETEIEDTLIHEMIHLKQFINKIYSEETAHGKYFRSEMKRINRDFGRNIKISEKSAKIDFEKNKPILHYFIISKFRNETYPTITRIASTKIFEFRRYLEKIEDIENVKWYGSFSPELCRLPRCLKLKFYKLPPQKIEDILLHPSTTEMEFVGKYFSPRNCQNT